MFKAPGKTIKRVIYAITLISWAIIALAVFFICINVDDTAVSIFVILSGLIMAALAYLANMVLYAFGQLVDDVQAIRKILEKRKDESSEQSYALPPL